MILQDSLRKLYSVTIDRSKFREVASRYIVFIVPLFFWGREPYWAGMILVALGVLVRAWGAGYLKKDESIAAGGPYLFVRHPLYLGSCLLALGFIVVLHHWFVTLLVGGVTFLTYWHTIKHEEQNLVRRFGESYLAYMKKAGPLWPKPQGLLALIKGEGARGGFSLKQYLKNREYECLLGVAALIVYLVLGSHFSS